MYINKPRKFVYVPKSNVRYIDDTRPGLHPSTRMKIKNKDMFFINIWYLTYDNGLFTVNWQQPTESHLTILTAIIWQPFYSSVLAVAYNPSYLFILFICWLPQLKLYLIVSPHYLNSENMLKWRKAPTHHFHSWVFLLNL